MDSISYSNSKSVSVTMEKTLSISQLLRCTITVIGLVVTASGQSAKAQYQVQERPAIHASATQMRDALLPRTGEMRGVGRTQPEAASPHQSPTATLVVAFEAGTDRLTLEGMRTLQSLAYALNDSRLQGAQFQIAAHSYTPADPQVQVRTSRRAQTIRAHLAGFYQVDENRLQAIGLGAQHAVNFDNPADPLNDRIEIINMSAR